MGAEKQSIWYPFQLSQPIISQTTIVTSNLIEYDMLAAKPVDDQGWKK